MSEDLQKVKDLLTLRNYTDRTITNYLSCINRFKNNYKGVDLENFDENDIIKYLKLNFISINCFVTTINLNRTAIKYYYLINFNKEFSNTLLPQAKIPSKFPKLIIKEELIKMINSESNIKHKIWLLLNYSSGLRISEIALLKVSDIQSNEHRIRVTGKGNKERYVPLPDITLKLLRFYWIQNKEKIINNFLFPRIFEKTKNNCINSFTIMRVNMNKSNLTIIHFFSPFF